MGFGLSTSYQSPLSDYTLTPSSSPFSVANSVWALPSLDLSGGFTPSPAPASTEPPLWQQILGGLGALNSLLDPYILTEQERLQLELERALAQAEAERARLASIQVQPQPAVPTWAWVVGGVALVLVLFLLLRE